MKLPNKRTAITWIIALFLNSQYSEISTLLKKNRQQSSERKMLAFALISWSSIFCLLICSLLYLTTAPTIYDINATIEKIYITPYGNQKYPQWHLENAAVYGNCCPDGLNLDGTLSLANSASIEVIRIGNNDLKINIFHLEKTESIIVTEDDDEIVLSDVVSILISSKPNKSHLFPIEGNIVLGGQIKSGSDLNPILLDGNISIIDKTLITREFYSVGPFDLKPGDSFVVKRPDTQSAGFIHIDEEKGFRVSYRSRGQEAYINRYKSESIVVKNGLLTKLYHDQTLIVFWFFVLIFFKIARMAVRVMLEAETVSISTISESGIETQPINKTKPNSSIEHSK